MTKMYSKNDLMFKDGYLVSNDGEVVVVDYDVVMQANELEDLYQKAMYLNKQPSSTPMPSLDGFKRKSINDIELFECDTPLYDKKVEESLALIEELDEMDTTSKMNEMICAYSDLVKFVKSDNVFGVYGVSEEFDTPVLGNPLEWTEATICEAIAAIHGCELEDKSDEQSE